MLTLLAVLSCLVCLELVLLSCRLLEILLKHCPGMTEAHLLLADSHHLAGASQVALRIVADVLHHVPDNLPAHLLLTRVYMHQVIHHCLRQSASQEPLTQSLHLKERKGWRYRVPCFVSADAEQAPCSLASNMPCSTSQYTCPCCPCHTVPVFCWHQQLGLIPLHAWMVSGELIGQEH